MVAKVRADHPITILKLADDPSSVDRRTEQPMEKHQCEPAVRWLPVFTVVEIVCVHEQKNGRELTRIEYGSCLINRFRDVFMYQGHNTIRV